LKVNQEGVRLHSEPRKRNNKAMPELSVRYPFEQADKETQNQLKPFFKQSSEIVEVSFPNPRVNLLKIVTVDYVLFVNRILPKDKQAYVDLGKTLADFFKEIKKGETGQVPKLLLTLDKTKIAIVGCDWEALTPFKKKADGWFVQWTDDEFVDFFS